MFQSMMSFAYQTMAILHLEAFDLILARSSTEPRVQSTFQVEAFHSRFEQIEQIMTMSVTSQDRSTSFIKRNSSINNLHDWLWAL